MREATKKLSKRDASYLLSMAGEYWAKEQLTDREFIRFLLSILFNHRPPTLLELMDELRDN